MLVTMLRWRGLFVHVLCLCVGLRLTLGQTTAATTLSTAVAGSVCKLREVNQTQCSSGRASDGSSSSNCDQGEYWILDVQATSGTTVQFGSDDIVQPNFVSNTTENGNTTFKYSVSCCYDVTPANDSDVATCKINVTERSTFAGSVGFPEDTLAHVAIGCGGGIVVMLCLVFALNAVCNSDQKKQAKYKAAQDAESQQRKVEQPPPLSQDTPRRPALDAVFDTGQRQGQRAGYNDRALPNPPPGSHGGYTDRPMGDPRSASQGDRGDRAMADPREQSYGHDRPPYDGRRGHDNYDDDRRGHDRPPYDTPGGQGRPPYDDLRGHDDYDDDGYDNWSFQHDDYERPRHQSQFAPPPREHQRQQQMRRHTEAPPSGPSRYDNHGEAARNFNGPNDRYDRHGRYSEMPQYDRGMRGGPPADFDMY